MTAGIEKINYLYVKQPESSPLRSNNLRLSGQISEIGHIKIKQDLDHLVEY